jgi:hypothetical protein
MADAASDPQGVAVTAAQRREFQSTMRMVDRRKPDVLD